MPDLVADVRATLDALSGTGVGDVGGVTGFCFGGGMTFNTLAAGVPVRAAVPSTEAAWIATIDWFRQHLTK